MSKIINSLKEPACQAAGFLLGVTAMKAINKVVNSETVSGILGDTTTNFKKYLTPVIAAVGGVLIADHVYDPNLKAICNGVTVSGVVDLGMELLYKKNLLSGTGEGIIGSIMGDDDDLEGDYDEEYDAEPERIAAVERPALPNRPAYVGEIPGLTMDGLTPIHGIGIM